MSAPLFPDDILFEQRLLKCAGFYAGLLNGKWNAAFTAAEQQFFSSSMIPPLPLIPDPRSVRNIVTLLPTMQKKAWAIYQRASIWGQPSNTTCQIISGTRTYAEQNVLFKQRPKVTNAAGGQSNHNFGIAIDVGLFRNGKYLTGAGKGDEQAYIDLAQAVKVSVPGIEWGGDWKSIVDRPHYQLATGKTLAQVRTLFEAGKLTF